MAVAAAGSVSDALLGRYLKFATTLHVTNVTNIDTQA